MNKIKLKNYSKFMGELIDVNDNKNPNVDSSRHIRYDDLLINHKEYLNKNNKYYIYCNGGVKSKKVVAMLEFYGYDVTLVEK